MIWVRDNEWLIEQEWAVYLLGYEKFEDFVYIEIDLERYKACYLPFYWGKLEVIPRIL